jgi:hypothetical protein
MVKCKRVMRVMRRLQDFRRLKCDDTGFSQLYALILIKKLSLDTNPHIRAVQSRHLRDYEHGALARCASCQSERCARFKHDRNPRCATRCSSALEINDVAHQAPHGDHNAARSTNFCVYSFSVRPHTSKIMVRIYRAEFFTQPRLTTTSVPVRFARHEARAMPSRRWVQQTSSRTIRPEPRIYWPE